MRISTLPLKSIFAYFMLSTCFNIFQNKAKCADTLDAEVMGKVKFVRDMIMKDYDKAIRPTVNLENSTHVPCVLYPRQIVDVDEESGLFSLDSFIFMNWRDYRLHWNITDYHESLPFHKSEIWVPDISVHNSHSSQVDPTTNVLINVRPTGSASWFVPILTKTTCSFLSQESYPYDEVDCIVKLGSWAHDGWEIDYKHNAIVPTRIFKNHHSSWELLTSKVWMEHKVTYYDCCPEPYTSMHFHFPMRRRPMPEIEATRIPCILIMALTLSIYWLPRDSSKKLLLSVFLFISLSILLVYVAISTRNPRTVLYGVSFLRTTMYIGIITILLQVFIVHKVATFNRTSRPPVVITSLLTGPLGKYLLLRSPFTEDKLALDIALLNEDSSTTEVFSIKDEWLLLASVLDRIFFLIMLLVTVAVHHL